MLEYHCLAVLPRDRKLLLDLLVLRDWVESYEAPYAGYVIVQAEERPLLAFLEDFPRVAYLGTVTEEERAKMRAGEGTKGKGSPVRVGDYVRITSHDLWGGYDAYVAKVEGRTAHLVLLGQTQSIRGLSLNVRYLETRGSFTGEF